MDRDRAAAPAPRSAPESSPSLAFEPILICAACGHAIARRRDRIDVAGAHAHTFKNPEGVDYRVGCFRDAFGCVAAGAPSAVWTWFPGYAWQTAFCAKCGEHLGWAFRNASSAFFALIEGRVVEARE